MENYNKLFCCYELFVVTYDDLSTQSTQSTIYITNYIYIMGIINNSWNLLYSKYM